MNAALTRLDLRSVPRRGNVYLRFGAPVLTRRTGAGKRSVYFTAESTLCRVWWERNRYGTTRWELAVLQAKSPGSAMQKMPGVTPGAALLLSVGGEQNVKFVLRLIDTLEREGIAPVTVAASYWRVLHNRLAGRSEVGTYGVHRHAAESLRKQIQ